ncbi:MAG: hypothetical protein CMQ43_08180 [Gammaproteobacteria bacterium]|nr:hypothetical protein [Gammaproteobacteria bacterium]
MPTRLVHGIGIAALLAGLAWWLGDHTEPALESAAALRGERWYRLMLDDRHVGYLHTRTDRDRLGRWRFASDLRFALTRGNTVRIDEQLVFAAEPPYRLLSAAQVNHRSGEREAVRIERSAQGYRLDTGDGGGGTRALELAFTLGDYLGFESWLRERAPLAGATVSSAALDFARRQVVPRQFRVVGRNATGYELENAAPFDATRIQLDERLRPVAMTLSGLFELELTSRRLALAPRTALQAASYFVPADRPLPRHTEVGALTLEVRGADAAALWPRLARAGGLLEIEAGLLSRDAGAPAGGRDDLAETADHPVQDPRIRALARQAAGDAADGPARLAALTRFVNGYLRYEGTPVRRHVLRLLDEPAGDCTEFADLLTTLARSLGMPARTVFGLAYGDGTPPAFRFHAWNEVEVDGRWQPVDPTWNQLRTDATHIPLPADSGEALDLLTGGSTLSFLIRDVAYVQ